MEVTHKSSDTRRLISSIFLSVIIKGGSLFVALLSTPLYIKYFRDDVVLGLWFTIYSILSWMLNFDLGIGNGLRNNLAIAISKNDKDRAGELIYSSYIVSFVFVLVTFVAYFIVKENIDWRAMLNIAQDYTSMEYILKAIDIVVISILMQMFLRTVNYIYYAEQKPNVNNIAALSTSVLIVLYLFAMNILKKEGNIVEMAYVNLLAVNLPLVIITIAYLVRNPHLIKKHYRISRESVNSVLGLGLKFFYIQIVYMIVASSNEFFINFYCNSSDVVEYSIYNRLFTIIGMAVSVLVIPVWSAITKAIEEKRFNWVKKVYLWLIAIGGGSIFINILLGLMSQTVFNLWLGEATRDVDLVAVWAFVFYGAAISMTSILSAFANGMGKIGIQAIIYSIVAVFKVVLAGISTTYLGWSGIIVISTIGLWAFVVVQYIVTYRDIKNLNFKIIE